MQFDSGDAIKHETNHSGDVVFFHCDIRASDVAQKKHDNDAMKSN